MFGRSPRTLRRIEKEEFDNNLTGNFARIKRRGRTLSDVDTRHRINERENRRAHKLGGYWNREELVAELRKPSKIREANNNGIPLKIYSRTTLLKRIKNAVNKGLIKPKQVSRYYYFKYEDFLRIARAIAWMILNRMPSSSVSRADFPLMHLPCTFPLYRPRWFLLLQYYLTKLCPVLLVWETIVILPLEGG